MRIDRYGQHRREAQQQRRAEAVLFDILGERREPAALPDGRLAKELKLQSALAEEGLCEDEVDARAGGRARRRD